MRVTVTLFLDAKLGGIAAWSSRREAWMEQRWQHGAKCIRGCACSEPVQRASLAVVAPSYFNPALTFCADPAPRKRAQSPQVTRSVQRVVFITLCFSQQSVSLYLKPAPSPTSLPLALSFLLQPRRHQAAYQIYSGSHCVCLPIAAAARLTLSVRFVPRWAAWKAFELWQRVKWKECLVVASDTAPTLPSRNPVSKNTKTQFN
jgi:hypothetical protein